MSTRIKLIIAAVVAALVVVVGGPFVYINLIKEDAPAALSFDDVDASTTAVAATTGAAEIEGTWTATGSSVVGYRVKEVLFGQSTEGVGRTSTISGSLTIAGTAVTTASFEVDMSTVTSDESRRDDAFRGRIMDVDTHPTAMFALTSPIELGRVPADREEVTATATGELTLKGVTRPVTFELVARRNGSAVEVNGSIPVVFADYGIGNPSFGGITTEDDGLLEFLLVFGR